jgi:hypothetical protein
MLTAIVLLLVVGKRVMRVFRERERERSNDSWRIWILVRITRMMMTMTRDSLFVGWGVACQGDSG